MYMWMNDRHSQPFVHWTLFSVFSYFDTPIMLMQLSQPSIYPHKENLAPIFSLPTFSVGHPTRYYLITVCVLDAHKQIATCWFLRNFHFQAALLTHHCHLHICNLCNKLDHKSEECALFKPITPVPGAQPVQDKDMQRPNHALLPKIAPHSQKYASHGTAAIACSQGPASIYTNATLAMKTTRQETGTWPLQIQSLSLECCWKLLNAAIHEATCPLLTFIHTIVYLYCIVITH